MVKTNADPDVRGFKYSLLIHEFDTLCQRQPLNCAIVNVLKSLAQANSEDTVAFDNWDRDTDVDYQNDIINDAKRCILLQKVSERYRDSVKKNLIELAVFYCEQRNVQYT